MKPDYYRVLGVSPQAAEKEIHLAYRRMAQDHHPDRNRSGETAESVSMALLNEAWATLGDASCRRAYDRSRRVPEPGEVQEAILAAARALLCGEEEESGNDLLVSTGPVRLAVRLVPGLGAEELNVWLQSVGVVRGPKPVDCAVVLACRVLAREEAGLRLRTLRFPAVAIDLIESRAFGEFPCSVSEGLFRPFLL